MLDSSTLSFSLTHPTRFTLFPILNVILVTALIHISHK